MNSRLQIVMFLIALPAMFHCYAQDIHFRNINSSDGLSDNLVFEACRDKQGIIWIATANGLNSYNGYKIDTWHHLTDKIFNDRGIGSVNVDDKNYIWLIDASGNAAVIKNRSTIQKIEFENKKDSGWARYFFPGKNGNVHLLVGNKLLIKQNASDAFQTQAVFPDSLMKGSFLQQSAIGHGQYLLTGSNRVVWIDVEKGKFLGHWRVPNIIGASKCSNGDLLVSTGYNRELFRIDTSTGNIIKNYGTLKDQFGRSVSGYLRYMNYQADGKIVISSGYDGIYLFDDKTETLTNFRHDPLDESTIPGNNAFKVCTDRDGYVFITSRSTGLSYYNCFLQLANTQNLFQNINGDKIFDGFVGAVHQDNNGTLWLGTQGGLMQWDPISRKVIFSEYGAINGASIAGKEEVRAIYADKYGRLWLGLNRYGIVVIDKNRKPIKYFNAAEKDNSSNIPANFILDIQEGTEACIWVSTTGGLCFIDEKTLRVIKPEALSALEVFSSKRVNTFIRKDLNEIWLATNSGVAKFDVKNNHLKQITTTDGLLSNQVSTIAADKSGNIYAGGRAGINIIDSDLKVSKFFMSNSLPEEPCVSLVPDNDGNIWIAGDNYLSCFFPETKMVRVFDKSYGFSGNGFRFRAYFKSKDGRLFFGCNEGVSWFSPSLLLKNKLPFNVYISGMTSGDSIYNFMGNQKVTLPYFSNAAIFNITPVAINGNKSYRFQYRIRGEDPWQIFDPSLPLSFQTLSTGNYVLQVQFSGDGLKWESAQNEIAFTIPAAWWQKQWVRVLIAMSLLGLIAYFMKFRTQKIMEKKQTEESERAILYLTTVIHSHSDIDKMLWDVVRNCISRIGLKDCVIYLLDTERNVLVQKAAWGPKTNEESLILNPIEIPVGKGIVGAVALSAVGEIVNDTTKDSRYIQDDAVRLSELCVPIVDEGKVLGVIDSEHPKRNFFKQYHFTILQTISSLLGSKIIKAKTEAAKGAAEVALSEMRRKAAEVEMQALRAQMNPHFMFNSLNSINNFILNNDIENASSYLTKFSRLMRLILDNSRHDWVPLEQELQALELYIGMESLRFDYAFTWRIEVGEGIDVLSVQIPPLLIQPYVENAIWHGLMHRKEPGGHLCVGLKKSGDFLLIEIVDNGVGREAANQLKSKFSGHKKSHGMIITSERMEMVNKVYDADVQLKMEDRINEDGKAGGTYVQLKMRYILQHQTS
jgi:ligand-binding sensor domain-containing protein/putative methionine-R-sulfoxide reductase with GAF domain